MRRLSSHPIDFAAVMAADGTGSPEFVSPRSGDNSVYGSPQEDFMSARSSSFGGIAQVTRRFVSQRCRTLLCGSATFVSSLARLP